MKVKCIIEAFIKKGSDYGSKHRDTEIDREDTTWTIMRHQNRYPYEELEFNLTILRVNENDEEIEIMLVGDRFTMNDQSKGNVRIKFAGIVWIFDKEEREIFILNNTLNI